MHRRDVMSFLRSSVPVFKGFPEERLRDLVEKSTVSTFESNEAIIEFGEEGRFLGVLLDGRAEASIVDDAGERRRLGVLGPGDIAGEMSLLTGDRTVADVVALSRCMVLLIPAGVFSSALVAFPPALKHLSKVLADRSRLLPYGGGKDLAAAAIKRSGDPYGLELATDEPMALLVVNCGSSSLKYSLFDTADEARNARGAIERVGSSAMRHTYRSARGEVERELGGGGHREAFAAMIAELTAGKTGVLGSPAEVSAVGHRVVHGGDVFDAPAVITDEVVAQIESLSHLAPLHNPVNLLGIREARQAFPLAPHVAVFDTAFHHTLPPYAYLYGLPYEYHEKKRIRRYGFHGMSHLYVALRAAQALGRPFNELEIITCHLGSGASLCAVDHGRSVDTTMGFMPTEGLLMGTRCGDIDPAVILHIMRTEGLTVEQVEELINRKSGLAGLSGISNDMREVERAAQEGDHRALLAFKTFCYRIRKYIGAYYAAMQGLDAIVFTGGIGQGSPGVRSLACQGLASMGIVIDEEKNRAAAGREEPSDIAVEGAPVRVLVVRTNEELMIARETIRALKREFLGRIVEAQRNVPVPIEVSAHHVHLCQEHVEALFGKGHQLTFESELSQPGQYACRERVALVGPKGRIERVRVLGPARRATQVEIAMTEQFKLGIHPPIRESGDLDGTPGLTIEGPAGQVTLEKGVVCALRHVHMSPEDALRFGVRDKYRVRIRVGGDRELIFGDVLVRVHPDFKLAMHLDTDEGNAANVATGMTGYIDSIQGQD